MSSTTLYITYLAKEGPFLKIWGQLDKNIPIAIDKALADATASFNNGYHIPPSIQHFSLGSLCCAKFSDDAYYRAKITNVDSLHTGVIEVLFIDYGNTDIVQCNNIRTMEPFSREFINIVPQAKEFYLMNVTHSGTDWDPVILEQVMQTIRYVDVEIAECIQIGSNYLIKLVQNGQQISSILKEAGYGVDVPTHIQQTLIQKTLIHRMQEPSSVQQPRHQQQQPQHSPSHNMQQQQQQQQQLARPTILTFKSTPLEPNSEHEVYMSYVTDGPLLFSIQLKRCEENLRALMNEINTMPLQPFGDTPAPSTMCLARSIEDGYICRGVVTNMVDGQYKIYYVDFGNTEMRSIDHIYEIPYKFIIPKLMATRFALDGLDKAVVSVHMKVAFKEFVEHRLLNMKVKSKCVKTGLPLCDIWDEKGIQAIEIVKQAAFDAYADPVQVTKGSTQPVHVTAVYSCNRFHIQLKGKDDELKALIAFMQQSCPSRKPLDKKDIYPGKPCAAQLADDNLWHRVLITEVFTNDTVKIFYVDMGHEDTINNCNLKQAHYDQNTMLRPQALQCSLNGYQNMPPDKERDTFLKEILRNQIEFTAKIVDLLGAVVLVDLIDGKNYNVASLLLEKLANSRSQISPLLIQDSNKIEFKKRSPQANENRGYSGEQRSSFKPRESKDNRYDRQRNQNQEEGAVHRDRDYSSNYDSGFMSRDRGDGFNQNRVGEGFRSGNREVGNRGGYQSKKFGSGTDSGSEKDASPKRTFGRQNKPTDRTNSYADSNSDKFSHKNTRDGIPPAGKLNKINSKASDSGSDAWDESSKKDCKATYTNPRPRANPDGNRDRDTRSNANRSHDLQSPPKVEDTPILASADAQYQLQNLVGTTKNVGICWFHNPGSFFVQLDEGKSGLKNIMNWLQLSYKKRCTIEAAINQAIVAQYPADNAYYRAIVLDVTSGKYKVQYVDFGNISGASNVYAVEEQHMTLPAQAVRCQLSGITPIGTEWPKASLMKKHFDVDVFTCEFVGLSADRFDVILTNNNQSIVELLIADGFAAPLLTIELPLLLCQEIKVLVNTVNSLSDFIIEVEPNIKVHCTLHNLAQATETFEATLKELVGYFVIAFFDNIQENRAEVTLYDICGVKLKLFEPDEAAVESISPLCAMPIFLSSVSGFVTHSTKTSVFIQSSKYTTSVALLLETMYSMYNGVENTDPVVPVEGYDYAVLSPDDNWYRGKVTSITNDNVTVHYIDYGNDETVNISSLRILDGSLYDPHELSIKILMDKNNESLAETELTVSVVYVDDGWTAVEKEDKVEIKQVEAPVTETVQEKTRVKEEIVVQPGQSTSDVPIEPYGIPIVVSHIDTPNSFYVQLAQDLDTIDNLQSNLLAQIDTFIDANEPTVGMLCGAIYNETKEWYRAEVLGVEGDKITVRFVDYGNSDVVDSSQSKLKLLPADLQSLERYSRPCSLYITSISSEKNWSPEVCARFEELAYVEGTSAEIIHQTEDLTYIHIYYNDINLAETLVNENHALKMGEESVAIVPIDSTAQPPTTPTTVDQTTPTESPGIPVQVSHIDSPGQFYVQLTTDLAAIEALQATLQSQVEQLPDVESATAGVLCAAFYSASQEWFRAQVLDIDDDITTVRFVDYGNTDVLDNKQTKVKSLSAQLLTFEQYARRCSLYVQPSMESSDWSQDACTLFEELAYVEDVRAEIIEQDDRTTYINLFGNNINIGNVLVREKHGQPMQFDDEAVCPTGFISHVNSPSEFWIQFENACGDLERIADQLERDASTFGVLSDKSPGTLCAAVFPDDDNWYRARILSNTVAGLEVLFIDYGNSCTCTNLRELPEDLVMTPALAQKCCLEKPTGVLQWSPAATETFKEIAADGRTIFLVHKLVPGETTIVQLYLDDEDITQHLLPITVEGYVSHYEKIDCIWIRKSSDLPKLEKWNVILPNAKNWPKSTAIDKIVAAYSETDDTWYRAKVIEENVEKDTHRVLLIDSGAHITTNDIRIWPEDCLDDFEPLANKYKLQPLPGYKWNELSDSQFHSLIDDGKMILHIEYIGDELVQLYNEMSDVRNCLHCVKSTPSSSHQSTPSKKVEQNKEVIDFKNNEADTITVKSDAPKTDRISGESINSDVSEIVEEIVNNSVRSLENILIHVSLPDKPAAVENAHEVNEVSTSAEVNIENEPVQNPVKLSYEAESIKIINDNKSGIVVLSEVQEIVNDLVQNSMEHPETSSLDCSLFDQIKTNDNTICSVMESPHALNDAIKINTQNETLNTSNLNEIKDSTNEFEKSLLEENVTIEAVTTDRSDATDLEETVEPNTDCKLPNDSPIDDATVISDIIEDLVSDSTKSPAKLNVESTNTISDTVVISDIIEDLVSDSTKSSAKLNVENANTISDAVIISEIIEDLVSDSTKSPAKLNVESANTISDAVVICEIIEDLVSDSTKSPAKLNVESVNIISDAVIISEIIEDLVSDSTKSPAKLNVESANTISDAVVICEIIEDLVSDSIKSPAKLNVESAKPISDAVIISEIIEDLVSDSTKSPAKLNVESANTISDAVVICEIIEDLVSDSTKSPAKLNVESANTVSDAVIISEIIEDLVSDSTKSPAKLNVESANTISDAVVICEIIEDLVSDSTKSPAKLNVESANTISDAVVICEIIEDLVSDSTKSPAKLNVESVNIMSEIPLKSVDENIDKKSAPTVGDKGDLNDFQAKDSTLAAATLHKIGDATGLTDVAEKIDVKILSSDIIHSIVDDFD